MRKRSDEEYWELSEQAERGELHVIPETALTGAAAVAASRDMLLWATETSSFAEAHQALLPGRPRIGENRGASPTIRARVTATDYAALTELSQKTGRTQSELVREGIRLVLAAA
jgi:hypothetical protein